MSTAEEYEEERRLCYVGFTRAKQRLFVTNAKRRRIFGSISCNKPSEFLDSIPKNLLLSVPSLGSPSSSFDSSISEDRGEISRHRITSQENPYSIGTKVLHSEFGSGVVIRRDGDEDNLKIVVFFKQAGKKTLSVKHSKLILL